MKSRFLILAALLGGLVYFQSCCCKKKSTDGVLTETTTVPVKITKADNGKTFHVKAGEQFEVTFNQCVGCAQSWRITAIDSAKISTLPNTYSNRSCTDCVGGSQDNTFHFKAVAAGKSELSFSYFDEKFSVTIEIE